MRKKRNVKPLPTIWHVPEELWNTIEPIIKKFDPPRHTGRSRIDPHGAMDAIIFRMRSGLEYMAPAAFAAKCLEQGSATLRLTQDKENCCEILS
jgi:hypothetical protein